MLDAITCTRSTDRGGDICSQLSSVAIEGTVAADAMIFLSQKCARHIVSCRQLPTGATTPTAPSSSRPCAGSNERQSTAGADLVEPAVLS